MPVFFTYLVVDAKVSTEYTVLTQNGVKKVKNQN